MRRMTFALFAFATPALAHPGDHAGSGLVHFLTQPDHLALLALAAVVAVVLVVKRRSRR